MVTDGEIIIGYRKCGEMKFRAGKYICTHLREQTKAT